MVSNIDQLLDVTVSFDYAWKVTTDLYVKPTYSHQYLHSSSCHPYHCKKGIQYSQALLPRRICSDPNSFDRRCNDLEKWLIKRGYSEREVRKQTLRAKGFSRDSLLDRENAREEQNKITFNLIYYPVFQSVKKISAELHLLLTPDVAHEAAFKTVPLIGVSKITFFGLCYTSFYSVGSTKTKFRYRIYS